MGGSGQAQWGIARLRVDQGVAVHFAGGGQQEAGLGPLRQAQHVHGADEACLDRLDRVVPAMHQQHRAIMAEALCGTSSISLVQMLSLALPCSGQAECQQATIDMYYNATELCAHL